MDASLHGKRILIYSHDSFGLGHLRRCRTIAHALVDRFAGLRVLIVSGSPIIGSFDFKSRVDFVRIPGVVKLRGGDYTSLSDHIDLSQTLRLRSSILDQTAKTFSPDLFLVDKEPLGLKGEVADTLKRLRDAGVSTVLGLRDILDDPVKLDWVSDLMLGVKARAGCYFVLGNHDVRHGQDQLLRAELERIGWQDLGGKSRQIEFRGRTINLVGNELPWIGMAPEYDPASQDFSIGVVHTPDLLQWGRQSEINLMLAGHAHGGQIRLPLIGPVVCPSAYGVRYASGVFEAGETLLHVSRGVSGYHPLRWRCRPELTQLVLTKRAS